MAFPIEPPIEPMLAKPQPEIPRGEGWRYEPKWDGFRALVFRDGPEVYIQSRDLKPLNRYFPELEEPLRAIGKPKDRFVLDGEIVIATEGELNFDALLLRIHPAASRVAMLAEQSPSSYVAFDLLADGAKDLRDRPFSDRRAALEQRLAAPPASVHLTPASLDPATARHWFEVFEGAGLDGVIAKPGDLRYLPGKREMIKVKHQRTADCVVAGFRWHKNGPGTMVGSLLLGLYDDGRTLQQRRGHQLVYRSPSPRARRGAGAAAHGCAEGPPLAGVEGGGGGLGGPADAGRDQPLEPRQGPVVGAAPDRARGRGGLRPPPGRPVPARHEVPALAAGSKAGLMPL